SIFKIFPQMRFQFLSQIHSSNICYVSDVTDPYPVCDSMWTNHENISLTIHTADCVPLMIADLSTKTIAIAHIGWKGLLNGVLNNLFDTLKFDETSVDIFIGPHIKNDSYVVGKEIFIYFLYQFGPSVSNYFIP